MAETTPLHLIVKPSVDVGKVVVGNNSWETQVINLSKRFSSILAEQDVQLQRENSDKLVAQIVNSCGLPACPTVNEFADLLEANLDYPQVLVARELITQGVAFALENGTDVQRQAIAGGSEMDIITVIPQGMNRLARDIRDVAVDPEIGARVDELEFTIIGKASTKSKDADAINKVVEEIQEWIVKNEIPKNDPRRGGAERVIGVLAQKENDLRSVPKPDRETTGVESTIDTFVNAEYIQQPIQLQLDTFPPSWFKRAPDRFRNKPENNRDFDWQQLIRARINLTNASYIKAQVGAMDNEAAKKNQYLRLSERELNIIYHEPGVKISLEKVVDDFFKRDGSEPKAYFLALKDGKLGEKERKEIYASFRNYQDTLVMSLMSNQKMSEIDAKAAVAMAWNFLYVCNVFESADNNRDIGGNCGNIYAEQIRAMIHPLSKAKRKFGVQPDLDENSRAQGTEEAWGGLVGGWFADMVSWSDTRQWFVGGLQNGNIRPFPVRIGASMIELLEVQAYSNEKTLVKMSMAQALMEKRDIKFGETDSNLFGDYCDKWDTFSKMADFCAGKVPLEAGPKFRGWTNTLADLLAKFRGMKVVGENNLMFGKLDDAETLVWIIANSVGLHRSARLLLTIPKGMNYVAYVDTVLQSPRLVMDNNKRVKTKNMLHANITDMAERINIGLDANSRNSRTPEN